MCYREKKGRTEVLLITSRGSGRWIIPKGWPMDGVEASGAALQEAWEEAGVKRAELEKEPIGTFRYQKKMDDGYVAPVQAQVYKIRVLEMAETFPEANERKLSWFSPEEAADQVREPGLQDILRQF